MPDSRAYGKSQIYKDESGSQESRSWKIYRPACAPDYGDGDGNGFAFFLCCVAGFATGDAAGLGNGAAFGAAIVF